MSFPTPRECDSLGDGVLGGLDLAEEFLWDAVIEGELAVQHGEEHHTQGPHVTGLAPVRPACRGDTHTLSEEMVPPAGTLSGAPAPIPSRGVRMANGHR